MVVRNELTIKQNILYTFTFSSKLLNTFVKQFWIIFLPFFEGKMYSLFSAFVFAFKLISVPLCFEA